MTGLHEVMSQIYHSCASTQFKTSKLQSGYNFTCAIISPIFNALVFKFLGVDP